MQLLCIHLLRAAQPLSVSQNEPDSSSSVLRTTRRDLDHHSLLRCWNTRTPGLPPTSSAAGNAPLYLIALQAANCSHWQQLHATRPSRRLGHVPTVCCRDVNPLGICQIRRLVIIACKADTPHQYWLDAENAPSSWHIGSGRKFRKSAFSLGVWYAALPFTVRSTATPTSLSDLSRPFPPEMPD